MGQPRLSEAELKRVAASTADMFLAAYARADGGKRG
jgi:hypothetical protein